MERNLAIENLYEDNPEKHDENGVLTINRLKKQISLKIMWQSVSGKWQTDWFVPNTPSNASNYQGISDFHICESVEKTARAFLQHCPIHNTQIGIWRGD